MPNATALTLKNETYAAATPEPTIAPIKGYFNFKFTPNSAGSVIPNNAEMPDADATPFNFLFCLITQNAAKAAAPCAIFDIVAIGKIKEPPVDALSAINWVSIAIKL